MLRTISLLTFVLLLTVSTASAHYLWVTTDGNTMNLYFEGGPSPGDGHYLDPFVQHGKAWIRTLDQAKPDELKMSEVTKPKQRWLTSKLQASAPRVIESYGKYGVYRYGTTDVLLHYYAKNFDITSNDQLENLSQSSVLDLDVRPSWSANMLQVQVMWQGKPAANRSLSVRGPQGFKANLKTDDKGVASCQASEAGRYRLQTSVEEKRAGTDDGKPYQLIRHHATLLTSLTK